MQAKIILPGSSSLLSKCADTSLFQTMFLKFHVCVSLSRRSRWFPVQKEKAQKNSQPPAFSLSSKLRYSQGRSKFYTFPALTSSSEMKLKEDMNPLLLQVFRSVVWVYSVITFIPWYFFSGAGNNLERARRIKARSVSGHPAGPYRAVYSQKELVAWLHPGVDTLDKMFEYAAKRFPKRDCLGTREVLSEEDERQPNGKIFKKVRHATLIICLISFI